MVVCMCVCAFASDVDMGELSGKMGMIQARA